MVYRYTERRYIGIQYAESVSVPEFYNGGDLQGVIQEFSKRAPNQEVWEGSKGKAKAEAMC